MHAAPDREARLVLGFGALLAATGVAMAALGSHAFADILVGKAALRFDSALRLHLMHAPALLALGATRGLARTRWWQAATIAIALGCIVFCGGLYLAALDVSAVVLAVVPAGGSLMMLGWVTALVGYVRGPAS
ncbi:MAG: DUF423 domain-containing protein [Rhodanobacteraceae bacterium]|nr:DUF423 domain-containing protein [Rhodanobacteraceae bacterium]